VPPNYLFAPLEALTDSLLSDPERRVLLALFSFRDKTTNTVWPSIASIAERANIKDKTWVSKITTSLADKGWLYKKKRGFTGCNSYALLFPERLSNLDPEPKLDSQSKMDPDTLSNLDPEPKCNELTNELTNKKTCKSSIEDCPKTDQQENKSKPPACPHREIVDLYHDILTELPRVVFSLWQGSDRERNLRARWKQNPVHQNLDFWRDYFEMVKKSDWHMGRSGNWKADLGWLIKRENFTKMIEKGVNNAR